MANVLPTEKQHRLLEFIGAFISEHGYAPSYREVMGGLEYKSVSTVAKHIDELIRRGWLLKRDNSARSVEVVYKRAGENSPAPSLPVSPDEWISEKIAVLYKDYEQEPTEEKLTDLQTVANGLRILDMTNEYETLAEKIQQYSA